jgi:hypothetical protein
MCGRGNYGNKEEGCIEDKKLDGSNLLEVVSTEMP